MTILSAVVLALTLLTLAYLRITAEPVEDEDDAKRLRAFEEYLAGKKRSRM
ncbi:MAG: hypothetical protein WAN43_02425 [Rhodomicrobium sp.]|jgi:hypothetical protein